MSERSLALKQRLRAGESVVGAWLTLADPVVAEVMASTGFDLILGLPFGKTGATETAAKSAS